VPEKEAAEEDGDTEGTDEPTRGETDVLRGNAEPITTDASDEGIDNIERNA
jgi:hypothetical protein